jgi:E3 SUMO-protein ligase NSE2
VIFCIPQNFTGCCNSRKVCGHSFSEDAIRQTFRGSPSVAKKCPASGCNKSFRLTDLVKDATLAKKVRNWNRRNQRAAEDIDAEEIIE